MFCPNCGTQNAETAQTCAKCQFQLKAAAAPKFKGTMLMMNQPGAAAGGPPRPAAGGAPPPSSDAPSFKAEAAPIGAGAPPAGASGGMPSRLKGTIVGVAPPNVGAGSAPAPAAAAAAAGFGAPPPAPVPDHQSFGSPQGVNPLGGTMALDQGSPFDPSAHQQQPAGGGAGGGFDPGYGAPPPYDPNMGVTPPPADFGGGPGFGGPPGAGGGGGGGGYGGAPAGAPPGGGAYGAPPAQHQQQQGGFDQQMNQGFNQAGAAFGQAGNELNNAFGGGGAMQPFGGGGMQPGGQPGAMVPPGEGKAFMTTLLLCLFAGTIGVHRFYTGHTLFGIIQLFTFGGCGIWTMIDLFMIITGKYTDAQGRPLVKS